MQVLCCGPWFGLRLRKDVIVVMDTSRRMNMTLMPIKEFWVIPGLFQCLRKTTAKVVDRSTAPMIRYKTRGRRCIAFVAELF